MRLKILGKKYYIDIPFHIDLPHFNILNIKEIHANIEGDVFEEHGIITIQDILSGSDNFPATEIERVKICEKVYSKKLSDSIEALRKKIENKYRDIITKDSIFFSKIPLTIVFYTPGNTAQSYSIKTERKLYNK